MAESEISLTPDAVAKILKAEVSTTHRIFNSNKNNLNNMRLVKMMSSEKNRRNTGTEAKWYILSIEGILTYLSLKNLRYEDLKSFPLRADESSPDYDKQIKLFRNIQRDIKRSITNFAMLYDYPIFIYWSQIHDSFENDEDRDDLYFNLMMLADYTMMLYPFYILTLRQYHTSDYRQEQYQNPERLIINEFQISFFNDMINNKFWMNKKSGIIKEALTDAIKDYEKILKDRKLHVEKIKVAYGV